MADERPPVDLMRPDAEHWRCCICFEARTVAELFIDPRYGQPVNVCAAGTCAEQAGLREWLRQR